MNSHIYKCKRGNGKMSDGYKVRITTLPLTFTIGLIICKRKEKKRKEYKREEKKNSNKTKYKRIKVKRRFCKKENQ